MADYSSTSVSPLNHPNSFAPIALANFPVGSPLYQTATAGEVGKAEANAAGTAYCVGLAATQGIAGERVIAQYAGPLELTAAQWDALTAGSGGLTPGSKYYVSGATAGHLVTTAPAGGNFVTLVGVALSATVMLINPGTPLATS